MSKKVSKKKFVIHTLLRHGSTVAACTIILIGVVLASIIFLSPQKIKQSLVDCTSSQSASDFACWKERFEYITSDKSSAEAFVDLRKAYDSSPFVRSQCHQLTHIIGREEAKKHSTISKTYKYGDSFCWSGFYHGAVEQFAKEYGPKRLFSDINSMCADVRVETRYSFYHYNCAHGIGHGVMTVSDNELFASLKSCDRVTDQWERASCYGGVFMENIMSDPASNTGHTTKYLKPEEPMYPCTAVDNIYKSSCYTMQSSYALKQINYDFSKMFDLCSDVGANFELACYLSIGRDASGNSVSSTPKTIASCSEGHTVIQRTQCAVGAVKDFISYYHDDTKAKELCLGFEETEVQTTCTQQAALYYKTF